MNFSETLIVLLSGLILIPVLLSWLVIIGGPIMWISVGGTTVVYSYFHETFLAAKSRTQSLMDFFSHLKAKMSPNEKVCACFREESDSVVLAVPYTKNSEPFVAKEIHTVWPMAIVLRICSQRKSTLELHDNIHPLVQTPLSI
jgi:hypothetical protein